jgi:hypothetical protein
MASARSLHLLLSSHSLFGDDDIVHNRPLRLSLAIPTRAGLSRTRLPQCLSQNCESFNSKLDSLGIDMDRKDTPHGPVLFLVVARRLILAYSS